MTIIEAIYSVLEGLNISTDDSPISRRSIYFQLKTARSELIKQELNKSRLFDGSLSQTIEGLPMIISDISNGVTNAYPILRSRLPLPEIIESENGLAITGLFLKNGVSITMTDKSTWFAKIRRRYQRSNELIAFIDKKYLWLDGLSDMDETELDLSAYYDDPASVGLYGVQAGCSSADSACKPAYMYDFNLPGYLSRRVIEITIAYYFRKLGVPQDTQNNGRFDIVSPQNNNQNVSS